MELQLLEKDNDLDMFEMPSKERPLSYGKLNKAEKIQELKNNIMFLSTVKNMGVIQGSESHQEYYRFFENEIYRAQIEDNIMMLNKILIEETKKLFAQ